MCDHTVTKIIEYRIFEINENDIAINDDNHLCHLCNIPLKQEAKTKCCVGYARKLKCGHYVHVSCQIHKTPDFVICSLERCKKIITDPSIYYDIIHYLITKPLPDGYKRILSEEEIKYLLNIYGIDHSSRIKQLICVEAKKYNYKSLRTIFNMYCGK